MNTQVTPVVRRRLIEGWASTPRVNLDGVTHDPLGAETAKLPVPLLLEHKAKQIGWVLLARTTEQGIFICAEVFADKPDSDAIWKKILGGSLIGLSVGVGKGATKEALPDGTTCLRKWRWPELSLVRRPKNPDARVQAAVEFFGWR